MNTVLQGFTAPHDVTVSRDGDLIYVGEITLSSSNLWKFDDVTRDGADVQQNNDALNEAEEVGEEEENIVSEEASSEENDGDDEADEEEPAVEESNEESVEDADVTAEQGDGAISDAGGEWDVPEKEEQMIDSNVM